MPCAGAIEIQEGIQTAFKFDVCIWGGEFGDVVMRWRIQVEPEMRFGS